MAAPRHRAVQVAVGVSATLAVAKLAVGAFTGSLAVTASGLDSALDTVASGLNWWAIHTAQAPPDAEHRFGHGKAESLAGLAQAAFVGGSGVFVITQAISRLNNPVAIERPGLALATVAVSTLATLGLVLYQTREARRTTSQAVAADRMHYLSDLLAGAGVMVAVGLAAWTGWRWVDPVMSLAVAAGILWTGFSVARQSVHTLMDHALPAADLGLIEATLAEVRARVPLLLGFHNLRTRSDGVRRFVEVHLDVEGDATLRAANEVYIAVVDALRGALPDVDLSIHLDPVGEIDPLDRD